MADAVAVTLPVIDLAGTTTGYSDDYDETCPYSGSTSPDVVYTFTPTHDMDIIVDMFGSAYDTKIYIYDQYLGLVACNDDYYGDYTSRLENVPVMADMPYYLVIDGYGGDYGDYLLQISEYEFVPCVIPVPDYSVIDEMEPPLGDGYVDLHNGGCNTDSDNPPLQPLSGALGFLGRTGWFYYEGANYRDTDWFEAQIGFSGSFEITGDAEQACWLFELTPLECDVVGVAQQVAIGPCEPGSLTIQGSPGQTIWLWVGPQEFQAPDGFVGYEFEYVLHLPSGGVNTEAHSWASVRDLYR